MTNLPPLAIHIPGCPVPWQRALQSKTGRRFTAPRSKAYKHLVAMSARAALLQYPILWPTDRRYELKLDMVFPDKRRRDDDNVEKAIKDALVGILWDDDCWTYFPRKLVTSDLGRKDYCGVWLVVTPLEVCQ